MNKHKKKIGFKKRGFVALFIVTFIGFLAAVFSVGSMTRGWVEAGNVSEVHALAVARFNAMSCISITRLKWFLRENETLTEELIEGTYDLRDGAHCEIESVQSSADTISIRSRSVDQFNPNISVTFDAKIDTETMNIISLNEQ